MMPITMGDVGQAYTIRKITGPEELRAHLSAMGFNQGTEIRLISKLAGNVIVAVKDSRVAIGHDEAVHIMV